MRGYGLPRSWDVDAPDIADIHNYGFAGNRGRDPGRSGEIRSCIKGAQCRNNSRRVWKKQARTLAKSQLIQDMAE